MRVNELQPGDLIEAMGPGQEPTWAVVVVVTDHPQRHGFALVVWRLMDGSWSFDCLSPAQDVPGWKHQRSHADTARALRWALGQHGYEAPL
jgi:hypothetical protein